MTVLFTEHYIFIVILCRLPLSYIKGYLT